MNRSGKRLKSRNTRKHAQLKKPLSELFINFEIPENVDMKDVEITLYPGNGDNFSEPIVKKTKSRIEVVGHCVLPAKVNSKTKIIASPYKSQHFTERFLKKGNSDLTIERVYSTRLKLNTVITNIFHNCIKILTENENLVSKMYTITKQQLSVIRNACIILKTAMSDKLRYDYAAHRDTIDEILNVGNLEMEENCLRANRKYLDAVNRLYDLLGILIDDLVNSNSNKKAIALESSNSNLNQEPKSYQTNCFVFENLFSSEATGSCSKYISSNTTNENAQQDMLDFYLMKQSANGTSISQEIIPPNLESKPTVLQKIEYGSSMEATPGSSDDSPGKLQIETKTKKELVFDQCQKAIKVYGYFQRNSEASEVETRAIEESTEEGSLNVEPSSYSAIISEFNITSSSNDDRETDIFTAEMKNILERMQRNETTQPKKNIISRTKDVTAVALVKAECVEKFTSTVSLKKPEQIDESTEMFVATNDQSVSTEKTCFKDISINTEENCTISDKISQFTQTDCTDLLGDELMNKSQYETLQRVENATKIESKNNDNNNFDNYEKTTKRLSIHPIGASTYSKTKAFSTENRHKKHTSVFHSSIEETNAYKKDNSKAERKQKAQASLEKLLKYAGPVTLLSQTKNDDGHALLTLKFSTKIPCDKLEEDKHLKGILNEAEMRSTSKMMQTEEIRNDGVPKDDISETLMRQTKLSQCGFCVDFGKKFKKVIKKVSNRSIMDVERKDLDRKHLKKREKRVKGVEKTAKVMQEKEHCTRKHSDLHRKRSISEADLENLNLEALNKKLEMYKKELYKLMTTKRYCGHILQSFFATIHDMNRHSRRKRTVRKEDLLRKKENLSKYALYDTVARNVEMDVKRKRNAVEPEEIVKQETLQKKDSKTHKKKTTKVEKRHNDKGHVRKNEKEKHSKSENKKIVQAANFCAVYESNVNPTKNAAIDLNDNDLMMLKEKVSEFLRNRKMESSNTLEYQVNYCTEFTVAKKEFNFNYYISLCDFPYKVPSYEIRIVEVQSGTNDVIVKDTKLESGMQTETIPPHIIPERYRNSRMPKSRYYQYPQDSVQSEAAYAANEEEEAQMKEAVRTSSSHLGINKGGEGGVSDDPTKTSRVLSSGSGRVPGGLGDKVIIPKNYEIETDTSALPYQPSEQSLPPKGMKNVKISGVNDSGMVPIQGRVGPDSGKPGGKGGPGEDGKYGPVTGRAVPEGGRSREILARGLPDDGRGLPYGAGGFYVDATGRTCLCKVPRSENLTKEEIAKLECICPKDKYNLSTCLCGKKRRPDGVKKEKDPDKRKSRAERHAKHCNCGAKELERNMQPHVVDYIVQNYQEKEKRKMDVVMVCWALTKVSLYKDGSKNVEVLDISPNQPGHFYVDSKNKLHVLTEQEAKEHNKKGKVFKTNEQ